MTKKDFLTDLREGLEGLPREETEDRVAFYEEMILDRIEEGNLTEEEAVAELGTVEAVVNQIIADMPLKTIVRERVKPKRRLNALGIVLIVVGSPIWLALAAALLAVVIAVYAVLWCAIIAVWTVELALMVSGLASVAAGIFGCFSGRVSLGIFLAGVGLILLGLAVLFCFAVLGATKGTVYLSGRIPVGIKKLFVRKEKRQ